VSEKLLSARETAAQLSISRATLSRFVKRESIEHYRVGDRVLCSQKHIDTYLASVDRPARLSSVVRRRADAA
jgi:excisionase family DNA binding protein